MPSPKRILGLEDNRANTDCQASTIHGMRDDEGVGQAMDEVQQQQQQEEEDEEGDDESVRDDSSSASSSCSASSTSSLESHSVSSSGSSSSTSSSMSFRPRPSSLDGTAYGQASPQRAFYSLRHTNRNTSQPPVMPAVPTTEQSASTASNTNLLRRRPVPLQSGAAVSQVGRIDTIDGKDRDILAVPGRDRRHHRRPRNLLHHRDNAGASELGRHILPDLCGAVSTLLVCTGAAVWLSLLVLDAFEYGHHIDGGARVGVPRKASSTVMERPPVLSLDQHHNLRPRQLPSHPPRGNGGGILHTVWNDVQTAWRSKEGGGSTRLNINGNVNVKRTAGGGSDVEALAPHCVLDDWQLYHFPNCNELHQFDLPAFVEDWKLELYRNRQQPFRGRTTTRGGTPVLVGGVRTSNHSSPASATDGVVLDGRSRRPSIGYVSDGLWRTVWAVPDPLLDHSSSRTITSSLVALKLMKLEHPPDARNLDRHRREALVMERLTGHPHVVDVHAHCGTTLVTEYIGTTLHAVLQGPDNFETRLDAGAEIRSAAEYPFDSRRSPTIRALTMSSSGLNATVTRRTPQGRLHLAVQVALGLQALHELPGGAVAHADLTDQQFLVTPDGRVKLNDFNRCRFVAHRNDTSKTPCPFRIPSAPGIARSPEEYAYEPLTEQIDMYSLANVLHQILSGYGPWDGWSALEVSNQVQKGVKPLVPSEFLSAPSDHALQNLTLRAYELDPTRRLRASELVHELTRLLAEG